jgi:hypothetical protein
MLQKKRILKAILILVPLSICSLHTRAQVSVGVGSGVAINRQTNDISRLPYTASSSAAGIILDGQVNYRLYSRISITAGVSYIQKNYSIQRTGPFAGVFEKFVNDYWQFSPAVRIEHRMKKMAVYVKAGGYAGYWVKASLKGRVPDIFSVADSISSNNQPVESFTLKDFSDKYTFNSQKDNRYEFGLTAGLGIAREFNKICDLGLEISYIHSLTDQQKNYMIRQSPRMNRTLAMTLTYSYCLCRKDTQKKRK